MKSFREMVSEGLIGGRNSASAKHGAELRAAHKAKVQAEYDAKAKDSAAKLGNKKAYIDFAEYLNYLAGKGELRLRTYLIDKTDWRDKTKTWKVIDERPDIDSWTIRVKAYDLDIPKKFVTIK